VLVSCWLNTGCIVSCTCLGFVNHLSYLFTEVSQICISVDNGDVKSATLVLSLLLDTTNTVLKSVSEVVRRALDVINLTVLPLSSDSLGYVTVVAMVYRVGELKNYQTAVQHSVHVYDRHALQTLEKCLQISSELAKLDISIGQLNTRHVF